MTGMSPSAIGSRSVVYRGDRAAERGSSLVWALFFVSLTTGILVAHSLEMSANRKTMDTRFRRVDLAQSVAESGLTDAISWLRRQPVQPVASFTPRRDLTAEPAVDETLDPNLGLVREFEVNGSLWGRYEVRTNEAVDVSERYGEPTGSVWDLGARGYLYERIDPKKPFDQKPNRLLSSQTMRTEARGLAIRMPNTGAVVAGNLRSLELLSGTVIDGAGGPAITYDLSKTSGGLLSAVGTLTGTPSMLPLGSLALDLQSVFGIREDQLRATADVVAESPRQLQGREMRDQLVFAPGTLSLDVSRDGLRGRMVLAIAGDFYAPEFNNSDFRGVLYVGGSMAIEGPFRFAGTLIVAGAMKVGGSADQVMIRSDPTQVTAMQNALSQYRSTNEIRPSADGGASVPLTDWRKSW